MKLVWLDGGTFRPGQHGFWRQLEAVTGAVKGAAWHLKWCTWLGSAVMEEANLLSCKGLACDEAAKPAGYGLKSILAGSPALNKCKDHAGCKVYCCAQLLQATGPMPLLLAYRAVVARFCHHFEFVSCWCVKL